MSYDKIPDGFSSWTQEERDRFLDERDKAFQREQFETVPDVVTEELPSQPGLALIRIGPASSVADPASPFWITRSAAIDLVRRLVAELDDELQPALPPPYHEGLRQRNVRWSGGRRRR